MNFRLEDAMLTGSVSGERDHARLLEAAKATPPAEHFVIDFSQVEFASISYLKPAVLGLARAMREPGTSFPPLLVAGLSDDLRDEVRTLFEAARAVVFEVVQRTDSEIRVVRALGFMEAASRETLVLLAQLKSATATTLATHQSPPTVTGWNNRLSDLVLAGAARRNKLGRNWVYSPLAPEVTLG